MTTKYMSNFQENQKLKMLIKTPIDINIYAVIVPGRYARYDCKTIIRFGEREVGE